jgi:hypothetical protein
MVSPRDVLPLVMRHVTRLLDVAEAALPESQFRAFRRVALNEFGSGKLGEELNALFQNTPTGCGTVRAGNETGKKGGTP